MATLFDITAEQRQLMAMLEDLEGEITPELEEMLEVNQYNLEHKAKQYRNAIMMNKADVERAKEEKKRIEAFIKGKERSTEAMQTRLKDAMLMFDTQKIEIDGGVGGKISFLRSYQAIPDDVDAIPDEFKTVKTEVKPDLTAIKSALKAGEDVPGAHLQENMNLQVK